MRSLPRASLLLAAVALVAVAATAQGPGNKSAVRPRPPAGQGQPPARDDKRPLPDKLPLPAGAVLVPYEMIKGSLHTLPMVLVRPDKYRAMEERIKELERGLHADRGAVYSCKLTGRVEGDFVILQGDLKVITEQPRMQVALGLKGAVLSADPDLDGQLPVITYKDDDGYLVQINGAGSHHLNLQLKLPVTAQRPGPATGGADRGFEVGLPGATVTALNLDLPPAVKEVRWNDNPPQKPVAGRPGHWDIYPGGARNLKVIWREPAPTPGGGPALAAHWLTTVTLQEDQALTEAHLTADDRRGAGTWRLWAPPGATLKVVAPEGAAYDVTPAGGDGTLVVKGPPAEHLEMVVSTRQPRPFARLPVGPFLLLGANRQEGAVEVRAAPEALRGFRLIYAKQPNVRQQDVKDAAAASVQARFQYRDLPEATRPGGRRRPPLAVEMKAVVPLVEASVEHVLRLSTADAGWQVLAETRIQATPLHNGADFLEVLLPRPRPAALQALAVAGAAPAGPFAARLADTLLPLGLDHLWPLAAPTSCTCEQPARAELQPLAGQGKARIQLPQPQLKKFTVLLKVTYLLPGDVRAARLELPRPLAALDRGGTVKVEVDDSQEFVLPGEGAEPSAADRHGFTTTSSSAPAFVDLAWRPYRPEVSATIVADVTAHRRHADVREVLRLPGRRPAAARQARPVRLRVSGRVSGLKVVQGGRLVPYDEPGPGLAHVEATADRLVLEYSFALPPRPGTGPRPPVRAAAAGRTFPVPLFWPADATRVETKVRVWSEPGTVPVLPDVPLPDERWKDRGSEVVPGRDGLPALVLEGEGKELPLSLRLLDSTLPPLVDVLADRVLIQVTVNEDGVKRYRARFLLTRLDAEHLDVELPIPLRRASPQILLGGCQANWHPLAADGKTARVLVQPSLYTGPVVLDVSYELHADDPEPDGLFRTALHPPVLLGDVFVGRVRWQVALPGSWVALPPGGHAGSEQRWAPRDWLLAPEPAASETDLEQWLTGQAGGATAAPASLVFWSAGLEPVALVHLPKMIWLFLCSGAILLFGIALLAAPLSRLLFGLTVGLLGLGVIAAGVTWPAVFPAVAYGCEPGAAVLVLLLALQWLLHRRYRRQVVFMPGFTRARPGSSLSRGSAPRPPEISTVDAPPGAAGPPGSSVGSAKEVST